jgi:hypothetical protein
MKIFTLNIGYLIGNNMSRLFGLDNVSLRRAEIYVDNNKGTECSITDLNNIPWILGNLVLKNFVNVRTEF